MIINEIKKPPRERAYNGIKRMIISGEWAVGERIPSEIELARLFNVSRGTLRSAIELLEQEGLIFGKKYCSKVIASSARFYSKSFVLIRDIQPPGKILPGGEALKHIDTGILYSAQENDKIAIVASPEEANKSDFIAFLNLNPFGIIVSSEDYGDGILKNLRLAVERGIYVVCHADVNIDLPFDIVYSDHAKGSQMLTELLLSYGCKKILRVWTVTEKYSWIKMRNEGYERALKKAGIYLTPPLIIDEIPDRGIGDYASFKKRERTYLGYLAEYLLNSEPIDAILLTSDCEYFPVASACRILGKEPGRDIKICGYDNYWMDCKERAFENTIPFATIDKRNFEMGKEMYSVLVQRLEFKNDNTLNRIEKKIEPELKKIEN